MKIIVAIVVYNRLQNIERWLKCWQQCEKHGAELVIIHTGEGPIYTKATYVKRPNIGFDIGSFQDVCRERLQDFPNDWDYLLWCCDDTLPMSKDFLAPYLHVIQQPGVGVACMKISTSVEPHVRTSGFMITKAVANRLKFPADPVTTKGHCYHFEHRGGKDTFTNQVRLMGLACQQVMPDAIAPLWDIGYWKRLDREHEHDVTFGFVKKTSDKVTFICTIYDSYPQIISSLLLQTHKNWHLLLIHDGPASDGLKSLIEASADERITFIEMPQRQQKYGHPIRKWALEEIHAGRLSDPDYIVISNADNYYVPAFINSLLTGFKKTHTAVASYCENMIHSYTGWGVIKSRVERGFLDCGQVMVKKEIACEVGWRDTETHSADWVYFSDIANKYSPSNFIKIPGCLFVHN